MQLSVPQSNESKADKHKSAMQKQKANVDEKVAQANEERGLLILLTGNGKGKSSSAFGMVLRCMGYGHKVGIVQFIKGAQSSGEAMYLQERLPKDAFYQMGTGFTWDSQDREADIAAAEKTWQQSLRMLRDDSLHLVVLDELTYMLAYKYLDEATVLDALQSRPREQTVVVTGRGGGSALQDIADTVSEIKEIKHGFKAGLKAREGIDF